MKGSPHTHFIAIFASGTGTNAKNIIAYFSQHQSIQVALIVCNKQGAGVVQIAADNNVPVLMLERDRFVTGDAYLPELQQHHIDFIVLAGFLWKIPQPLIDAYRNRIVNIHPALLPRHGGRGMYGGKVHDAVLTAGDVQSGITIHYVDEHYDNGDIILQTACPVLPGDTAEILAQRIHHLEYAHYPQVIEKLLMDREE